MLLLVVVQQENPRDVLRKVASISVDVRSVRDDLTIVTLVVRVRPCAISKFTLVHVMDQS
jgi:hypothetical protein